MWSAAVETNFDFTSNPCELRKEYTDTITEQTQACITPC